MTFLRTPILILAALLLASQAMATTSGYLKPPQDMADLVDAPRVPFPSLSPDRTKMLLLHQNQAPPLSEVAREELRLAGIRFNPKNSGPSRSRGYRALSLVDLSTGKEQAINGLPEGSILRASWAPSNQHIACTIALLDRVELWLISVKDLKVKRALDSRINAVLNTLPISWAPDGNTLLTMTVPNDYTAPPSEPALVNGPNIQETSGENAAVRTFQDLLASAHDEDVFSYFLTAVATEVSVDGKVRNLGDKNLYSYLTYSPDGQYILAEYIKKPFSYIVPYYRFPTVSEVWDANGKMVTTFFEKPLEENRPKGFDSTSTGRRRIDWRPDKAASISWVEAQDGGDANREVEIRDILYSQDAPFNGEITELARFGSRYRSTTWGEGFALYTEYWWRTRHSKTWYVAPGSEPKLVFDRSTEDRYSDPGRPMRKRNQYGQRVAMQDKDGNLLYMGNGASEKGNIPFLDRRNFKTGKVERIWESQAPYYEQVYAVLNPEGTRMVTSRQSKTEPANIYLRDRDKLTALTHLKPTPGTQGIQKEIITFEREDGVKLTGNLYLPAGYKPEDGPLPTLLWAYPIEYKSAKAAGQMSDSPYRYSQISYWGPHPFLLKGYAVLDNPTMPIIGEGEDQPNDTFRNQLVTSAKAAIDALVARGVTDPDRVAIGGHSYGAFMVANLLAHSDLFRAGIARSGAYNRTLTPFGFQREERTFWEAQDVYATMSPFFHAEKIDEPLLLIHGEADNNSGTFPLQSKRLFHAVKGLGGTARLVMLPYESHGYRARESLLHMLAEEYKWMEEHVKKAKPRNAAKNPT